MNFVNIRIQLYGPGPKYKNTRNLLFFQEIFVYSICNSNFSTGHLCTVTRVLTRNNIDFKNLILKMNLRAFMVQRSLFQRQLMIKISWSTRSVPPTFTDVSGVYILPFQKSVLFFIVLMKTIYEKREYMICLCKK